MKPRATLAELLFPTRCLGCRILGIQICATCRRSWNPHIYRSIHFSGSESFSVYSAVMYSPIAGRILLAAKEESIALADQLIVGAIVHALTYFIREVGDGNFVPVPSRAAASRLRGRDFLAEMSDQAARPFGARSLSLLRHGRIIHDQSRLSARQRAINIGGGLTLKKAAIVPNDPLIIIDDLVTTGASLSESVRIQRESGARVRGAVTACQA